MEKLVKRWAPRKKPHKEIPFAIFGGFWISYIVSRLFIYLFPELFTNIHGVHVHHFSYGIIILTLVGFYSLVLNPAGKKLYKTAFIFGIALALTYDEFGMWLHLTDTGVERWGYDAVVLIAVGFINLLYLERYWLKIARKLKPYLPAKLARLPNL